MARIVWRSEVPVAGWNDDGWLLEVFAGLGMQPLHLVTARSQVDGIGTTAWEVSHILDTRQCQ